jgi:hypothetical protein
MFSSSVDFILSSVPPKVAQGCGLWPPTESAKLILGKDLRFEAAKPLLETSTDLRSVTYTDDRDLYVTKGAVKPTLTVIPVLFKSGNTYVDVSAVIFVSISSFSSSEEYNNENPFDSSSLSLDNGFVFLGA